MTERAIFNRKYTDFTPGGTQVWLVNGAGVTTSAASTQDFTAGANLIQGEVVYVSGVYALPASAASGVSSDQYQAIGITAAAASASSAAAVSTTARRTASANSSAQPQPMHSPCRRMHASHSPSRLVRVRIWQSAVRRNSSRSANVVMSTTSVVMIPPEYRGPQRGGKFSQRERISFTISAQAFAVSL